MGSEGRRLFGPQLGAASALWVRGAPATCLGKEQERSLQCLPTAFTVLLLFCHLWGSPLPASMWPQGLGSSLSPHSLSCPWDSFLLTSSAFVRTVKFQNSVLLRVLGIQKLDDYARWLSGRWGSTMNSSPASFTPSRSWQISKR